MDATKSASYSALTKIHVPDFTGILLDSVKDIALTQFKKLPYWDTPYYLYGLFALGGLIVLLIIMWIYKNFIR
jgi:hypothetical protein